MANDFRSEKESFRDYRTFETTLAGRKVARLVLAQTVCLRPFGNVQDRKSVV